MSALASVLGLAAIASLAVAAPISVESRDAPSNWASGYLEKYDVYHLRYLALDCQDQHNTTFFDDCCHPLLSTQSLSDRASYCTPNATEIASASSYIASTSLYGVPTASSTPTGDYTKDPQASTVYPTTTASTESNKAAFAQASSTTPAYVAPTTTTSVYVAPTTSTSVYVAPTTKTTTAQAAATTAASSSNVQTGGYATYFYQNGNAGACGSYHSDSDHIVAIDSAWWPDMGGSVSSYCGKSLTIKNTNNGQTTYATVADVCPTCVNGNSLDLSVGAFQAIASESDGMVPITWWWN